MSWTAMRNAAKGIITRGRSLTWVSCGGPCEHVHEPSNLRIAEKAGNFLTSWVTVT